MGIKEISGITNNEVLVDTFIKTEVKTFSLFNLTSELNNNIEKTREQIQEIQDKIVKFNAESHYDPAKHLPEKPPKPTSLLGCGPKANSLDPLGSIVTPSIIAEDSDDDDDDGVVLTMEEMRNKVKQKVKASLDLE